MHMRAYDRGSYNLFPKINRGQRTGARSRRDLRWQQKIVLVVTFGLAVAMGLFTAEQVYRVSKREQDAGPAVPTRNIRSVLDDPTGGGAQPRLADGDHDVRPDHAVDTAHLEPTPPGVATRITVHNYLSYFRPLFHGGTTRVTGSDTFLTQAVQSHVAMYDGAEHQQNLQQKHAEDELWDEPNLKLELTTTELAWGRQLDALTLEFTALEPHVPVDAEGEPVLSMKREPVASLSIESKDFLCPAVLHDKEASFDTRRNMLFILGAQKGGTTWMFQALQKHPLFIGAEHAYGQGAGQWSKEIHYFNRWPLPMPAKYSYMSTFPRRTWRYSPKTGYGYSLLDATPDYMFNAMAPPRIKMLLPQSKFLVLLRDPVTRAYSAWKMSLTEYCKAAAKKQPDVPCDFPSFPEVVLAELAELKRRDCLFNVPDGRRNWGDCYQCSFTFTAKAQCAAKKADLRPRPCNAPTFVTLGVGQYAAQIAWWYNFFPADRFKFVASSELRHGGQQRLDLLNSIKEFAGVEGDPFDDGLLRGVWGFNGGYDWTGLTAIDKKALRVLRLFYRQSLLDLNTLLQRDGTHSSFVPLEEEPLPP